jgi:hypothetical protein
VFAQLYFTTLNRTITKASDDCSDWRFSIKFKLIDEVKGGLYGFNGKTGIVMQAPWVYLSVK